MIALTAALLVFGISPAQAQVTRYLTGNGADVDPLLSGPVFDLGGGGADVASAFQALIDGTRGCTDCDATVDVVVLRTSGADGYNDFVAAMAGVDSVETLVVTRAGDASKVVDTVRDAEVVFFAGGDQCTYTTVFGGAVRDAVKSVVARGGGVGGTSAGMAIQAQFAYDGCLGSVVSAAALANPYDSSVTFTTDHFHWPVLSGVVTDTHFVARERMGRLMVFLSRQLADGRTDLAIGLAADEASSLFIDRNGRATVMGTGDSYVVVADGPPEVCQPRKPLTHRGFKVWRLSPGDTFDLSDRPTEGFHSIDVVNGVLSADPYR